MSILAVRVCDAPAWPSSCCRRRPRPLKRGLALRLTLRVELLPRRRDQVATESPAKRARVN